MICKEGFENLADSKKLAEKIVRILEDKKAKEIKIIDITAVSVLADYFIICTGSSSVHIRAIADELDKKLVSEGVFYYRKEGYETARWVLLDFGEVVVHVFNQQDRNFYNLERIWSDGVEARID